MCELMNTENNFAVSKHYVSTLRNDVFYSIMPSMNTHTHTATVVHVAA